MVSEFNTILGADPLVEFELLFPTTFSHLYVLGIELKVTVAEFAVNVVVEIRSNAGVATEAVSNCIPDEALDLAVKICPLVPTATLLLDDPSNERMSPFALVGLIPIAIMTS